MRDAGVSSRSSTSIRSWSRRWPRSRRTRRTSSAGRSAVRRALLLAALALLLPRPAGARSHPESFSRTQVAVGASVIRVAVSLQALTLLETLPALDADRDGVLAPAELEDGRERVSAYALQGLRLLVPGGSAGEERPLGGALAGLRYTEDRDAFPEPLSWIELELRFPLAAPVRALVVEHELFLEQNPDHRDFTSVTWEGESPLEVLFGSGWQREEFASAGERRPRVVGAFLRLGTLHILSGYDHLAFLVVLIVASRRLRSLVGVVTAFTAAHSLSLAAAALGWVDLPARLVELSIALSIAYVACENLLQKEPRTPWIEAFGFGLLHGLGFAGFLQDALAGEPLVLSALFGFNLGVELGQLAVVVPLVLLCTLLPRGLPRPAGIVPRRVGVALSALVAACGFLWFFQRTGWFA